MNNSNPAKASVRVKDATFQNTRYENKNNNSNNTRYDNKNNNSTSNNESNKKRKKDFPNKIVDNSSFSYLEKYCENVTAKISKKIDNFIVYGRDREVREVQIFLNRSIKNSPLLIGEAGVGKTAIVDGLCTSILKGDTHPSLKGNTVWSVEMAGISSETDGEGLVAKLDGIVKELKEKRDEYILFIDEIHTIMGAGGEAGGNDAGQSLKTALARGEIRIIGATTLDEYERFLEPDKALERRFQIINVEEPNAEQAKHILNGICPRFEREQHVKILEEAIDEAVNLSMRYIPERYLPDKAIDLIDEACATVNFNGGDTVTKVDIARVIERLKRIPLRSLIIDDSLPFVDYEEEMKKYVKGQDVAVRQVAEKLYSFDEGLKDPNRPIASFLFLGTTGVGKTELAKAVARVLFGSSEALIRIDCSEYGDPGDVKKLIGSNNHASPGILTSKVKKQPYSVVLLDEFEKADKSFYDAFLQVLDDGRLTTGVGRTVDFKNTLIIITTNAGHEEIKTTYKNKGSFSRFNDKDWKSFYNRIDQELQDYFRPEFINRFSAKVVFDMLTYDVIHLIAEITLNKAIRLCEENNITIQYDDEAQFFDYLISKGANVQMGARPMERLIRSEFLDAISKRLARERRRGKPAIVTVSVIGEKPDGVTTKQDRRYLDFTVNIIGQV